MFPKPSVLGLLNIMGALARGRVLGFVLYQRCLRPGHHIIAIGNRYFFLMLGEIVGDGVIAYPKSFGHGSS